MKNYVFKTKMGRFLIEHREGYWRPVFDGESLGAYNTPQEAACDLAGGHTFWPSAGFDPSTLGIPEDLGEWAVSG